MLRHLSFTGQLKDALDLCGWAYAHMVEALDIFVVSRVLRSGMTRKAEYGSEWGGRDTEPVISREGGYSEVETKYGKCFPWRREMSDI